MPIEEYLFRKAEQPSENLRNLLGTFMQIQQMKKEESQRMWERGIEERELAGREKLWGAQAEYYKRRPTEYKPTTQELRWNVIEKMVGTGALTPEEGNKLKAGISLTDTQAQRERQTRVDSFSSMVKNGINRINTRLSQLDKPLSAGELAGLMSAGRNAEDVMRERQGMKMNLAQAQTSLSRILGQMATTNELPSQAEIDEANMIYQYLTQIEKEGRFWEKPTERPPTKKWIKASDLKKHPGYKDLEIRRDPSGFDYVILNGEKHFIRKHQ